MQGKTLTANKSTSVEVEEFQKFQKAQDRIPETKGDLGRTDGILTALMMLKEKKKKNLAERFKEDSD